MLDRALNELRPNAKWLIRGSVIEWFDETQTEPSQAEIDAKVAELTAAEPMRILREKRNFLLAETDWWVLPDRTATQAQLDYRQALRDITDNATSLDDVTWPTKP